MADCVTVRLTAFAKASALEEPDNTYERHDPGRRMR